MEIQQRARSGEVTEYILAEALIAAQREARVDVVFVENIQKRGIVYAFHSLYGYPVVRHHLVHSQAFSSVRRGRSEKWDDLIVQGLPFEESEFA